MKCIIKDEDVRKVEDSDAQRMVNKEGWKYCAKSIWKERVRDKKGAVKVSEVLVEEPVKRVPKEKKGKASSKYRQKKAEEVKPEKSE